ncbi:5-hydroxyisourate hydrolase [Arcticibacter pallidicorallinus]|uniref:5-hydroxyisourate hydrolase n=1 Tax=Arcticibacter pallidicorallinus TaxID=1259464 RepID=A0A2T0TZ36_9SPHI|nr:hydroxyisourate hydrolase [Arcticibacter pallidicorallinus]PRY50808.1 5-hydroxyisourate hydrolase [Arcticibacter pallidicorallinus]
MKKLMFTAILAMFSLMTFAQNTSYQLSSHILDVSKGSPASGVKIRLEQYCKQKNKWSFVDEKITDKNGRITKFLSAEKKNRGIYKLTYYTSDYFKRSNTESFYPFIEVVFQIKDGDHYHVPITLSAYGYSTYRGN